MRLLRRNALGVYGVYAASIVSGLVVTPLIVHHLGKAGLGVWTFIGGVTIYLSVLDFGVGPSVVRFGAEARGRGANEDLNEIASTGLFVYAVIGLITLPVGAVLAWLVPWLSHAPHGLVWDARISTFLVVLSLAARFPLGLFNNLLVAQQRWDLQNLGNFVSTALYAGLLAALLPFWSGLVLLGAVTLGTTLLRLLLPLAWLRKELPGLRVRRRLVTRERLRQLLAFSWSNFLVHVAQKIVFSTDVVVIGIVLGTTATGDYTPAAKLFALAFGIGTAITSLMLPAFAELEGAGDVDRQRHLLLSGLRAGTATMLLLALPLLLMPDLLIHAWIGGGFRASYAPMALLAAVLLVHQPMYVLTQFLIARAMQKEVARVSILTTLANLALSIALAEVWGIWGVALSTLVTDVAAILFVVPRLAAPAASSSTGQLARAVLQPLAASLVAAGLVLVAFARAWRPQTMPECAVVGVLWTVVAGCSIWRFGLSSGERASMSRHLRPRQAGGM
ncbi:MAG TPA: oligosaccharide flippase family protein [Gaiellaceae bacterium]|jgi:O-antigen/teichoic acid export membrane protein|nr:oligosaccharide flippase family protein [Gaiellaceae bacterium]